MFSIQIPIRKQRKLKQNYIIDIGNLSNIIKYYIILS